MCRNLCIEGSRCGNRIGMYGFGMVFRSRVFDFLFQVGGRRRFLGNIEHLWALTPSILNPEPSSNAAELQFYTHLGLAWLKVRDVQHEHTRMYPEGPKPQAGHPESTREEHRLASKSFSLQCFTCPLPTFPKHVPNQMQKPPSLKIQILDPLYKSPTWNPQ